MTHDFNAETGRVQIDMSLDEWDLFRTMRFAAANYQRPYKFGSDLHNFVLAMERINNELWQARIQKYKAENPIEFKTEAEKLEEQTRKNYPELFENEPKSPATNSLEAWAKIISPSNDH